MFEKYRQAVTLPQSPKSWDTESILFGQNFFTYVEMLCMWPKFLVSILEIPFSLLSASTLGLVTTTERVFLGWLIAYHLVITKVWGSEKVKHINNLSSLQMSLFFFTILFIKHWEFFYANPDPMFITTQIFLDILWPEPILLYCVLRILFRNQLTILFIRFLFTGKSVDAFALVIDVYYYWRGVFLFNVKSLQNSQLVILVKEVIAHNYHIESVAFDKWRKSFKERVTLYLLDLALVIPHLLSIAKGVTLSIINNRYLYYFAAFLIFKLVMDTISAIRGALGPFMYLVEHYIDSVIRSFPDTPPVRTYRGHSVGYEFPWVLETESSHKRSLWGWWKYWRAIRLEQEIIVLEAFTLQEDYKLRYMLTTPQGQRDLFLSGAYRERERFCVCEALLGNLIEGRVLLDAEHDFYKHSLNWWYERRWGYLHKLIFWRFGTLVDVYHNVISTNFVPFRLAEIKAESVMRYLTLREEYEKANEYLM